MEVEPSRTQEQQRHGNKSTPKYEEKSSQKQGPPTNGKGDIPING